MGLFDAFSADDETRKYEQGLKYQTDQIGTGDQRLSQNFDQARDYLTAARTKGTNYLTDQAAIARGDINGAQTAGIGYLTDQSGVARNDINNAMAAGQGFLSGGADQAATYLNNALTPWNQLAGIGMQGVQSYGDLIGLNPGIDQTELLRNTPGYQWQMDQGLDAINRLANSRGELSGGGNTQDLLKYSQGLADQTYQQAVANRTPYFGMAENAAAGQASVNAQLSGLYDRLSQNQAGLAQWGGGLNAANATQLGQDQSNLAQWAGGQNAANANQLGSNLANLRTGTATQLADNRELEGATLSGNRLAAGSAGADAYGNMANAGNAADAMGWNALLGLTNGIGGGIANYVGAGGTFS
jgi:hypothetical protein